MTEREKLESLPARLADEPSVEAWWAICAELDALPDTTLTEAILYRIDELAASWPDDVRTAPVAWRRRFFSNPNDSRLRLIRELDFTGFQVGPGEAAALADSTSLRALRVLILDTTSMDDVALSWLAAAQGMPTLSTLVLSNNTFGAAGMAALAQASGFTGLEELSLAWCEIGDDGLVALSAAGGFRLKTLQLPQNAVGDAGVRALAGSPAAEGLRTLALDDNRIGDEGAMLIASAEGLRTLEWLSLAENPVGNAGIASLAAMPSLRLLDLQGTALGADGQAALRAAGFTGDGIFERYLPGS
jgi:Ran GTPase-activating protein (RanGAP) involved in mRNA processing and transport